MPGKNSEGIERALAEIERILIAQSNSGSAHHPVHIVVDLARDTVEHHVQHPATRAHVTLMQDELSSAKLNSVDNDPNPLVETFSDDGPVSRKA